jgi:RNA polymerase sigma-70 factor, ECF subfamily
MSDGISVAVTVRAEDSGTSEQTASIAIRRDAAGFTRLYQQEVANVYRFLASRVATREAAEDLTGDAFQRAWRGWPAFRGEGRERAWLFGIVRRTLADHYRSRSPFVTLPPEIAEGLTDETLGPEESSVYHERMRQGQALLAQLKPEQQEILCLRFLAELTYAEIAQVVGKREDAVKKIAYRAIEEMKRRQTP